MSQRIADAELLIEEVESAALQLPREDRARLEARLLNSLDQQPHHEEAWAAELRERIRAFKAGEMKAIPEEQALQEAEELIASLDEETRVEQAWEEEVRRRVENFHAGKAQTRPLYDVLSEVDELLR
jgi:putative addiction module component (TIGR02574 family)